MSDTLPGGPAFLTETSFTYHHGMSLRDYFAAKAMQAMLSRGSTNPDEISQAAYIMAGFMLKVRDE